MLGLDELEQRHIGVDPQDDADRRMLFDRLMALIRMLRPFDRQPMVLYHTSHMQAARADVERTATPSLRFVRAYLETRREFHRGVWFWSRLVVMLPGVPVLVYGFARVDPGATPIAYGIVAVFLLMIPVTILVQRRGAHGYQSQIDALNHLERQAV